MEPTRRLLLAAAVCAAGIRRPAHAARSIQAGRPAQAVIELFTSQGCSSCPPADRLLGQLAADPGLVTLSLPVDYWDRLGWKDTLAQHAFTARQEAYAARRGDGDIYTPQAVVNGGPIAVGSDRDGILGLARTPLPVRVSIEREGDGLVALVQGAPPDAVIIAAPTLHARTVAIGRGENASARVTYTNVVTRLVSLGPVGRGTRFRLPDQGDADAMTVLVQEGSLDAPGRILGAARV